MKKKRLYKNRKKYAYGTPVTNYIENPGTELTENDIEIATEQDIKVQKYFEGFTDKKKVEAMDDSEEQEGYEQTAPEDDEEDDKDALPF